MRELFTHQDLKSKDVQTIIEFYEKNSTSLIHNFLPHSRGRPVQFTSIDANTIYNVKPFNQERYKALSKEGQLERACFNKEKATNDQDDPDESQDTEFLDEIEQEQ